MSPLDPPRLSGEGLDLRSEAYGDIYFQPENGLAESRHVFLDGADLPARIARLSPGQNLAVLELGFGTGLNVLALMSAFEKAPKGAHLHVFSVEAHPLPQERMRRVLTEIAGRWGELAPHADALSRVYPDPVPGWWHARLSPSVTLTVAFEPAARAVRALRGKVDAVFLDGFAPDRNPDMWAPDLLAAVAARLIPGGRVASFTVAGAVRRALAAAGLTVEKRPGFGRKREQLHSGRPGPWVPRSAGRVAVIGAGIGGTMAAWHLARCGAQVTLIDRAGPGSGASGNPAGLVMPRIEAADRPEARFYRDAFYYAAAFYAEVCPAAIRSRGGVRPASDAASAERHAKVLATGLWSEEELRDGGNGALDVPGGLCIDPSVVVAYLAEGLDWQQGAVTGIETGEDGVVVALADRAPWTGDAVVMAAGTGTAALHPALARDLTASRGQIDWFAGPSPERIIAGGSYAAPWGPGAAGGMVAGATYDPWSFDEVPVPSPASTRQNEAGAEALLGHPPGPRQGSRAAVRVTTRDRHPLVGTVGDGRIAMVGGLGSRGLVTAPLLGAEIAATLLGMPQPLDAEIAPLLSPGRFDARRARRGE